MIATMLHHTAAALLAALASCIAPQPGAAPAPPATPSAVAATPAAQAVLSVSIPVSDLDRLTAFYTDVLGFTKTAESESAGDAIEHLTGTFGVSRRTATLRLGQEQIELVQYLAPEGRPIPPDSRSNDRWFQHIAIVVADIDKAYAHLRRHHVRHASSGPQTLPDWNPSAGGIAAFYFKDPDGHVLEIIHFPSGKGDPRWQGPGDRLFLGIDHTAIVVADTDRSLAFYRDLLGLRTAGASENYGSEQEHLNNVFGARLRITALRAPQGPGVELLEYIAPATGREYPADSTASDLISWTTNIQASPLDDLAARLRAASVPWTSPGVVTGPFTGLDADVAQAAQVRDPDGHRIILQSPRTPQTTTTPTTAHAPTQEPAR